MTPYQLNICLEEHEKNKKYNEEFSSKQSIAQAYLISRWVWAKKIDIDKALGIKEKEMTDEQMLAKVKALNQLFGGNVKIQGGEMSE